MVSYDLAHLTQAPTQEVIGPIQDDEALLLFALVRVMQLRRILEIGGLGGYSARNFCAAVGDKGTVYTVDINPAAAIAKNHRWIQKDARLLNRSDLDDLPLDLVFFDCHNYAAQLGMFERLTAENIIIDRTVFALHDTNTHPAKIVNWAYPIEEGWVHQATERRLVNEFKRLGYDVFSLKRNAFSLVHILSF